MTFEILSADILTDEIQQQIEQLYQQLNAANKQVPVHEILVATNNVHVFICKIENKVVGMALLSCYKVISGYRGLVEDVVVDKNLRGNGIGRKLMENLLSQSKKIGLDEILLFTGHHRSPAIALYKNLGFTLRESGLYNLRFS